MGWRERGNDGGAEGERGEKRSGQLWNGRRQKIYYLKFFDQLHHCHTVVWVDLGKASDRTLAQELLGTLQVGGNIYTQVLPRFY